LIRALLLSTAACVLIIAVVMGFLLYVIIDEKPDVERLTIVTAEHVERAKQLLDEQRELKQDHAPKTIDILAEDVDIAANYLIKLFADGKARINLSHQQAEIYASLPVSAQLIKGYINFQAILIEKHSLPQLQSVRVGQLIIPDMISQFLTQYILQWLKNHPWYGNGINSIKKVQFSTETLKVKYHLSKEFGESNNYSLPVLSKAEQAIIYRYHFFLVQISRQYKGIDGQTSQPLSQILQPLMEKAAKYSDKNRAPIENRAAILAATCYILKLPLKYFIPEAVHWPRAKYQVVTLDGRQDFAQHFIVSAAITAYADTFLSDAIGLYKEIEDARSGSGFSFNDIAADRAGTLFGERATTNQVTALQLQQWVSKGITDKDLMPVWSDLPEHLPKPIFRKRYGNMDTLAYYQVMNTIEQRVAALPFLQ